MIAEIFVKHPSVLYLGASVTAQKNGFRQALHSQLESLASRPLEMQVSCLGGVGSLFGYANFRRNRRVGERVGLAIFEYSTGDLNLWITPKQHLLGVLRDFLVEVKAVSELVVIVHNYRSDFTDERASVIRNVYDSLAEELGIPVVDIYRQVATKIDNDADWLRANYRDHVHPTELGAAFVADSIYQALRGINSSLSDRGADLPVCPVDYVNFSEIPSGVEFSSGSVTYPATGQDFAYIELSERNTLSINVDGELMGIVLIMGPRSCHIDLKIDSEAKTIGGFDRNCHYQRPHCQPLVSKVQKNGKLTISHSGNPVDFSVVANAHPDFKSERVLRLCGIIGRNLSLSELQVV